MAEEHGFRASEGHRLCLNNCGFVGSPATQNFCSKCYNEGLKSTAKPTSGVVGLAVDSLPSSSSPMASSSPISPSYWKVSSPVLVEESTTITTTTTAVLLLPLTKPNRCSTCRKKVGLTGFRCRCGITFCGTHRYPEQHGCSFDYKTMGREAIAKANPLIKAEKLEKI